MTVKMEPKFRTEIKEGCLVLTKEIRDYCRAMKDCVCTVSVRKYYQVRTLDQNRYYWAGIVAPIQEHCGYQDLNTTHQILKAFFISELITFNQIKGEPIDVYIENSTKYLNTKEFAEYCEKIRLWANTPADDYILVNNKKIYGLGLALISPDDFVEKVICDEP